MASLITLGVSSIGLTFAATGVEGAASIARFVGSGVGLATMVVAGGEDDFAVGIGETAGGVASDEDGLLGGRRVTNPLARSARVGGFAAAVLPAGTN